MQSVEVDGYGHVSDQLSEFPVDQDLRYGLAQGVADLPAHLVYVIDQPGKVAVGVQPLDGGLLPHPGNAGEVVARVAAQGREVCVLSRIQSVLLDDGFGCHPSEIGHSLAGIQHRGSLVDQLKRVTVTAHNANGEAAGGRLGG